VISAIKGDLMLRCYVKEFKMIRVVNRKEKTETEVTEVYGIIESGL